MATFKKATALGTPIKRALSAWTTWFERFDPRPAQKMRYELMQNCRQDYDLALCTLRRRATEIANASRNPIDCLDVACGTGSAIRVFNGHFNIGRRVGLDQDLEMLSVAQSMAPGLETLHHDMENLRFNDGEFDLILAAFAYHHVRNPLKREFCERLRLATKTGGRIIVLEICLENQESITKYYAKVKETLKPIPGWQEITETFMSWTSRPNTEETGEYKVGMDHLLNDFGSAGWRHLSTVVIWPLSSSDQRQGCFMFEFATF